MRLGRLASVALAALGAAAGAAAQGSPFQIRTTHLPLPERGQPYHAQLKASGGTPPYRWAVLNPALPNGLVLDEISGTISGAPASNLPLHPVLVQVEDSASPALVETRLLPFAHGAPLAIAWTTPPAVAGTQMTGAVQVTNGSDEIVSLTVIVTAVNEAGKAFALRYDRRDLETDEATPQLAFQVEMPPGSYIVHVDAVAEVADKNEIYRDREQSPALVVPAG